jgi:hypothetical protein
VQKIEFEDKSPKKTKKRGKTFHFHRKNQILQPFLTRNSGTLSAKHARYRINGRKRAFFGVFFYISPVFAP